MQRSTKYTEYFYLPNFRIRNMKRSHFKALFLFILLYLTIVPQTNVLAASSPPETIMYATPYDLKQFNIYRTDHSGAAQWIDAVSAGLIKRSAVLDYAWTNDLAKSMPEISNGNLTFTFALRDNLYFSNGAKLTLDDIKFSFQAALTPKINVGGNQDYSQYLTNDSVMINNDKTISFTLTKYDPFPYELFSFVIIPKQLFETRYNNCVKTVYADCAWNSPDGSDAISAGAYMIERADPVNQTVVVKANPYYYNAAQVRTDKIIFEKIDRREEALAALADGTIDIMSSQYATQVDKFEGMTGVTVKMTAELVNHEIAINSLNPYMGTGTAIPGNENATPAQQWEDARLVRQAMSFAMNRSSIVDNVFLGFGMNAATNMPAASIGWDPTLMADPYNLTHAKELMTKAGFDYTTLGPENPDGIYNNSFFNITILHPIVTNRFYGDKYAMNLPKIGIGVTEFVNAWWTELMSRAYGSKINPPSYDEGGYDVLFWGYGWNVDWNPGNMYTAAGSCSTGDCTNFYNFDLGENMSNMAELVHKYLNTLDFDARLEYVKQLQHLIAEDKPMIPILNDYSPWAYRDTVKGLDLKLLTVSLQEWDLVYKEGFVTNQQLSKGTTKSSVSTFFFLGLVLPVYLIRRRKLSP